MEILKLIPAYKDYIWGGKKLKTDFGKHTDLDIVAESWELSCHPNGQSTVFGGTYDGKTLSYVIKSNGKEILGSNCKDFEDFPILIKLIDSNQDLSVQVHPGDSYAIENEGQYGKTEMWYVVDCEKGAYLYYGFNKEITRDELAERIQNNSLTDVLNKVLVKKGDVFFIRPGTVHAICKGIVIAEIQQNSDLTYRIYDYNRLGPDKSARELHIKKALDVSILSPVDNIAPENGFLAKCKYFSVMHRNVYGEQKGIAGEDSFQSLLFIGGHGRIECGGQSLDFDKGDCIFIPANAGEYNVKGNCEMLITFAGTP